MKKVCMVCGYTPEDDRIKECPNCGSYAFKKVEDKPVSDRFRRY